MANKSRSRKADDTYNARRRYARAAIRNLEKAESSSGATAARYRQLAKSNYDAAVALYDENPTSRRSANMQRLEAEFGFDEERVNSRRRDNIIEQSTQFLEKNLADDAMRREREARMLLNDSIIGSRILGGLVEVWKDAATILDAETGRAKIDNKKIVPAILKYFQTDSLAEVIAKLEETIGSDLYALRTDTDNIYETVKMLIQTKVIENEFVQ